MFIYIPFCPKCGCKFEYYSGCLGYESMVCPKCKLDIQDIKLSCEQPKEGIYFELNYNMKGV